jgi:hypothetical protein
MKLMKATHKILGAIWMSVCAYFFANLVQAFYRSRPDRLATLGIDVAFALLFLAGAVAGFCLLIGARWPRVIIGFAALLTVLASMMGLFAVFNAPPFSFAGITFDIFALASAEILLLSRRCAAV